MMIAIVLAVLVVSASSAPACTSSSFVCKFQELGNTIKENAISLGGKLAQVGTSILDAVITTGSDLLVQGSKAVLGTIHGHLSNVGKRALVVPQISDLIALGKQQLQAIGGGLKDKLKATISKLVDVSNKITGLDITDKIPEEVDGAVDEFKNKATSGLALIKDTLKNTLQNIIAKANEVISGPKRGISDFFSQTVQALQNALSTVTDAMKPHVQTVIGQVTDLGQQIKNQAATVVSNVKQSVTDLSQKLTGHVNDLLSHGTDLVQHGKDALGAVQDAISQIAAQTLDNVKGTLGSAASVGKDAVSVVVDHVSGGY